MKNTLANILLAGLLAALPMVAASQEPQVERSCEQVENMLKAGSTPTEVVAAMFDTGMALTGATVFAMKCAPAENREALAEAGVGLATTIIGAESVVAAVTDAFGEGSAETKAARKAAKQYKKQAKQPRQYNGDKRPGGSVGVSPS